MITTDKEFTIVAYSFGAAICLELVSLLEKNGYNCKVVFIDGSIEMMKLLAKPYSALTEHDRHCALALSVISNYSPTSDKTKIKVGVANFQFYV